MSELAITNDSDEILSAWAYRDMFFQDEIQFHEFRCPFCDIPLVARAIYKEEAGKSPHFAIFPHTPHLYGCDGRPQGFQAAKRVRSGKKIMLVDMNFPQELVPRRRPKEPKPNPVEKPHSITPEIVQERRLEAGSGARHVPTSSRLADFVDAYRAVTRQWQSDNPGKKTMEWAEIKAIWGAMPLKLADETNYADGFRPTTFIQKSPRVYNGKSVVSREKDGLFVSSESDTRNAADTWLPFQVCLPPQWSASSDGPKWRTKVYAELLSLSETGDPVKWYAYGMPEKEDDKVVLRPASLDHFYFYRTKR